MPITVDTLINLSTPKKLALLGVVIFVVSALFFRVAILPKYKILEKKELEYNRLKTELAAQRAVAQDIGAFQARLDKVKKELAVMKAQLPDKKEIPNLLKTISSLGKESGLHFQLFRPKKEVSKDFYAEIPVEIKVVGGYNQVADFFYKVGRLDRIVNISNVIMENPAEEDGEIKLNTFCLATTFRFVEASTQENEKPDMKKGGRIY